MAIVSVHRRRQSRMASKKNHLPPPRSTLSAHKPARTVIAVTWPFPQMKTAVPPCPFRQTVVRYATGAGIPKRLPIYRDEKKRGAPQCVRDLMEQAIEAVDTGRGGELPKLSSKARQWLRQYKPIHQLMRGTTNRGLSKLAHECVLPVRLCAICCERDNTTSPSHVHWITIPCGHEFHQTCIDKALLLKSNCPLCRQEIVVVRGGT